MKIIKIISISILLFSGLINVVLAADSSSCTKLEIKLPGIGTNGVVCGPAEYLAGIYKLSLGIGVFLAAVVIVMAGIKYATSGDNSGKQKEAREDITQAIFGLLILFGSVIILRTINPDLADLGKWEGLPEISIPDSQNTSPTQECLDARKNQAKCQSDNCTALVSIDPTAYSNCLMTCTIDYPTTICNQ
jgi:hypothetical protein